MVLARRLLWSKKKSLELFHVKLYSGLLKGKNWQHKLYR